MLATSYAPALRGIDGRLVSIECDITNGLPGFTVVGLGDKAVNESRERVRSAIKHSNLSVPPKRITLNLAPADLRKDGSGYDLGIAVAILAASGQLDSSYLQDSIFLGELALNGEIRPVKGALIAAQLAASRPIKQLFLPRPIAAEAGSIPGVKVYGAQTLRDLYDHLSGSRPLPRLPKSSVRTIAGSYRVNMNTIIGQTAAKRAAEIAAAGNHNLLLSGPPGTGKTLLAKAIADILPPPSLEESIEITKLHDLAGSPGTGLVAKRPIRSPHHTISCSALIGGTNLRPGEISLSHNGVLFLDELPEFSRDAIEALRQPLEDGRISIARSRGSVVLPADFMLVATRNPCPCGYAGDASNRCACLQSAINRYQQKISGPVMERFDITVDLHRIQPHSPSHATSEDSRDIAQRVASARRIQTNRFSYSSTTTNSRMSNNEIEKYCKLDNNLTMFFVHALRQLDISTRSYMRILKVARTIADLECSQDIQKHHLLEALRYRPTLQLAKTSIPERDEKQSHLARYVQALPKAKLPAQ